MLGYLFVKMTRENEDLGHSRGGEPFERVVE
jgi:hypothetical protein